MGKIQQKIDDFLAGKGAQTIHPIPALLPNQRGPSCGFYALSYVLTYWHRRFELHKGNYQTKQPLPARTNLDEPKQQMNDRKRRDEDAARRSFTSLRQYGKFNKLTVLGSVFDAENLVKVARGENSQYAGQFDGRVYSVSGETFAPLVKAALEWECPVVVPYDVSVDDATEGEPITARGDAAHWVAIIGHYKVGVDDYALYFNWGEFYTAKLESFAVSNAQLTSNRYLTFAKYRVTDQDGNTWYSDYGRRKAARSRISAWNEQAARDPEFAGMTFKLDRLGKKKHNPEFNDPTQGATTKGRLDDMDGRNRLQVGGLRNRVVVIYRKEDAAELSKALAQFT